MRISRPPVIHKKLQSPQAAAVPIFRVLVRFWLPIRPGGLPYAGAVPMPDAFPHTFSADPPYHTQAPKIRLQSRRDQRPAYADPRIKPTYSNSLRRRGGHGHGVASRCDDDGGPAFKPARRPALRPRAWIPEESGQIELDKSPQMRRQGNRIRRTDDGSRRPPARPGVTLAPGFAVSTSLLYHVFLEVSR